ncbi:MAG TPA: hypothetical protein VFG20_08285 [Planctomycetaceae bacterium]|jgi:hypothetical protein|nr:hypothetical protein [Planctomycetaceae bacterium]
MWPWILGGGVGTLVAIAGLAIPLAKAWQRRDVQHALKQFRLRREVLEARFFDIARGLGKPRGLRWIECDWQNAVSFARDKQSGLLTAFVAVNIRFEAVEGGEMEDVAAVSTVRDAAAVFHYRDGVWGTGGRALFNMNPADAVRQLSGQFSPISALESVPR